MRRALIALAALATVAGGSTRPTVAAEAARTDADCVKHCGDAAAKRCDDVESVWCSVYIAGCLAGCGVASL